ncbi:thioredoxin family protein [Candidatus Peregrinibacteria bacterium HGW-Peregrinibacteria-1]|jgi:peroxiredoxin|nr:MAG: thioredoxin family protein [Candidatus Peregrinibacteria bacterium HGW-Peregrinibacteria-1]
MVLLSSANLELGSPAQDFNLQGIDGKFYSLMNFDHAKVLVVVFMCNHCPYVQRIWKDLVDLQLKYLNQEVNFVGINPNFHPDYPDENLVNMAEQAKLYRMNFPYLLDETQMVAKRYGAQCTPDIFVFDEGRELRYHGRIDDGELDRFLANMLRDEVSLEVQNPSMGCSIKWQGADDSA